MSRSVNKVILVGNVGRDPDVATIGNGTKVAHLSLATSRRVQKNGTVEERTDWHRLTLWDRLAELAEEYICKGDRLYVEGRIEYDSYEKNGSRSRLRGAMRSWSCSADRPPHRRRRRGGRRRGVARRRS